MKVSKWLIPNIFLSFLLIVSLGCDVTIIDVSEREFFLAKEWKIVEYYKDNERKTNEILDAEGNGERLENFNLKLNKDYTFERVIFNGEKDFGTWSLNSVETELRLISDDPLKSENWAIGQFEIRKLELVLDPNPVGGRLEATRPVDVRYILEPVKGQ